MTLDQGRDVGVVRPGQQIALPMTRKRLEILKEAMPKTAKVVYLSSNEWLDSTGSSYREAGQRLGIVLIVKYLSEVDEAQLRRAFDQIAEEQFDAALIDEGGSFLAQRALIVDLAQLLRADEVIE
jgi:putative ABC transport system substrate-binding protein